MKKEINVKKMISIEDATDAVVKTKFFRLSFHSCIHN